MDKEKIGILTYTARHRKTYDVLCMLRAKGYEDVTVYASPFTYQKKHKPFIEHRPEVYDGIPRTEEVCRNFGYAYMEGGRGFMPIEPDRILLVAGAGILPGDFVKKYTIINAHPGYIPNCRGLDALKWAILEGQPIGVTSHLIGEDVDAGLVIARVRVPVYSSDTFHALAHRVYETEISMLVEAVGLYRTQQPVFIGPGGFLLHKRMPDDLEASMLECFERYKKYNSSDTSGPFPEKKNYCSSQMDHIRKYEMEFININAQYNQLKHEIDQKVLSVMEKSDFIMGDEVAEFEKALASYTGVGQVISCASGTDALQLIFMAYGIGRGDAVFCPDMTFIASMEPACLLGAVPVFCEIDEKNFNISPQSLEKQIINVRKEQKYQAKAIVAVDFLGNPAPWEELSAIAKKYGLILIEDAAQSMGASYGHKKCGAFGDIAATSFFPTKPLGAYGDGGAVLTNDDAIAAKIRSLRQHGKGKTKYVNERIGINSRLDTIQTGILNVKIRYLDIECEKRQRRAERYRAYLKNVQFGHVGAGAVSANAQFVICLKDEDERDRLKKYLGEHNGIPAIIYYPKPLHQLPVFCGIELYGEDFSAAIAYGKRNLGLPFSPYMSDEEQDTVIEAVNSFFKEGQEA